MRRPRRVSPGFLILEHWFQFHLLIVWSNLKRPMAMHGTPKIPSESLSREVSCWAGSDKRCDFACREGTWTMWKSLLLKPGSHLCDPQCFSKCLSGSTPSFFQWK